MPGTRTVPGVPRERVMGERPILAGVTVGLLVVLLVTAGLTAWWSDRRLQVLEERMTELELLTPKLEAFKQEVGKDLARVRGIEEAIGTVQKTLGPLAKMDRSMDALSEKVGKEVAPQVEQMTKVVSDLQTANTQLRGEMAALQQQLSERMDKQGTVTNEALVGQAKTLQSLATGLQQLSETQTGLLTEITKLEGHLKSLAEAQDMLAGTVDEVKMLAGQLDEVQRAVESLKKQLEDVQKKLVELRRMGPAT